ncbi:MAG TPA: universal stress protein [candidate division Zixibacteria bacterium]|nr:universal stress protein [candidate division Zixibacteria bacterium]
MSQSSLDPLLQIQLKSILVATDFSQASDKALNYAVAIARKYDSKVFLVNVVSALAVTVGSADVMVDSAGFAAKEIEGVKERLKKGGALDGITFQTMVLGGDIWQELERVIKSEHIELLVIGTHNKTGFTKLALGSTAELIFRKAGCPVITVGHHCLNEARVDSTHERRILFPTDFGEQSLRPLPYALWLARRRRARLVVLSPASSHLAHSADVASNTQTDATAECIDRMRSLIPPSYLELEPIYVTKTGDHAEMILRTAKEHDVEAIVMGITHTKYVHVLARMPWSTAHNVVCGAHCPVLTVRV